MHIDLRRVSVIALAALLLGACGQTGPLVLPDKKTTPAAATGETPPPAEASALEDDPLAAPSAPLQLP